MPVFNTAQYLREALSSVRSQQFDDFELVVVNDGSTDESSEILRAFSQREPRMRLIERPNQGLIYTRNQLLQEARGDLVAWMDSDDVSHPERYMRQVAAFDADPELVCLGTNVQVVDPDGMPLGVEEFPHDDAGIRLEQSRGTGFRFPSTMQRRSAAIAAGGFRHPFRIGEDLDFLLRVAEQGRVANLPDFLYVYRQHLLNTCTTMGTYWPEYRSAILKLADERRECGSDSLQRGHEILLPQFNPVDARKLIPVVLVNWAREALAVGDRARACRYILRSIKISPLRHQAWRQLIKTLLPL
jgi:glycosyltransferase involved in cell wall biosynthesis